jgi:hypothetical protein
MSHIHKGSIETYARLFAQKYPAIAAACNGRIERAVKIATTAGACRESDQPGCYEVHSESNPRGWYTVDPAAKTCTCPDDGRNKTKGSKAICKHRLAVGFKLHGAEWLQEEMMKPYKIRKQVEEAWQRVTALANLYENLSPEEYFSERAETLRGQMLKAEEQAETLQCQYHEAYTSLYAGAH